ncbi:diphthine--ammonia ligase [uncultured Pontibacter sp.]|uniref:Dph6-related ATP pyrophosphatase n=1 Tax=uncultured Pontibacter sp. TaxID=453356 RepID=UPI002626D9DD|nr:diphthine--ammonia ligase [uncultured Pontibacter sp.]
MKSFFNWSGGKDAALCLYHTLQQKQYDVELLLTTLSSVTKRVTMHGVRQELLEQQATSIGLPLQKILLPEDASMAAYDNTMKNALLPLQNQEFTHAIFGDINLEDLRLYREQQLAQVNMQAVFPLWGKPTKMLVREFIDLGFKAVVVSANARVLNESFVGRILDHDFIDDLPATVDPAGENGEYHTFVFDGPIFRNPVKYTLGEKVLKTYGVPATAADACFKTEAKPSYDTSFWFCDLLPPNYTSTTI